MTKPASKIVVQAKGLISQNVPVLIEIGLISHSVHLTDTLNTNGFLDNITSLESTTYRVVSGEANFFNDGFDLYMVPLTLGTIVLEIYGFDYFTNITVNNSFSLWCIPELYYPKAHDLEPIIYGYLPPNCYVDGQNSIIYDRNNAIAKIFADVYNSYPFPSLRTFFDTIYPPFANDTRWEQMLNTGPSWQGSHDYKLVIQTVRNVFLQNTNPYDCSLTISTYIFARLGITTFVYIEHNYPIIVHIQDDTLTSDFLNELTLFIEKLFEPQMVFTIELGNASFKAQDIFLYIGDTYGGDPRLYTKYALRYSDRAVYNAQALISPFNPIFFNKFYILPKSGTYPSGYVITMRAIIRYMYNNIHYEQDVTADTIFVSDNIPVIAISSGNIATCGAPGVAIVTGTYTNLPFPTRTAHVTYTVNDSVWILDISALDVDTILG